MLCVKCGKRQATVHMQQIINGEKSEMHFCEQCASASESPISFEKLFQNLVNVFAIAHEPDMGGLGLEARQEAGRGCPACQMTIRDFKNSGKLGCMACYETFNAEMDAVLKNVQGSSLHQGKFPKRSGAMLMAGRKIEGLRVLLSKAVAGEEYEEAARLRDRIKELEAGVNGAK